LSNKIEDLSPECQEKYWAQKKLFDAAGIPVVVLSTLRTPEEQHVEFVAGNSKCDGYIKKSYHQSGNAFDQTFADAQGNPYWPDPNTVDGSTRWLAYAAMVESVGLVSGVRFKPLNQYGVGWDPNHCELES
jgi:hypothetical protein